MTRYEAKVAQIAGSNSRICQAFRSVAERVTGPILGSKRAVEKNGDARRVAGARVSHGRRSRQKAFIPKSVPASDKGRM